MCFCAQCRGLFSHWNLVKMCGFLSPAAKTRAFQTKQTQKPSRMQSGLRKYYLEVDLCRMVRGKNPKSSLHPKPGLQDAGTATLAVSLRLQDTRSFYLDAKSPPKTCGLDSRIFTSLSLILGKQGWQGGQLVSLPHAPLPAGTRSSPLHNPALPEPFPAHIKLLFLSAPSPHTQHIPFMCSAPRPYLCLSP